MSALSLPLFYIIWHYTGALKDFWRFFFTILWFLYHFFSLPILVRTFFAPWRRLKEHTRGHPLEDFIANTALRLVGIVMRSATIVAGVVALILAVVLLIAAFFVWLSLPLLVPMLLVFGIISLTL